MYTITLSDGAKLENLTLNGNNFITSQEISEDTFRGKLSHVNIDCDDDDMMSGFCGEFHNMELIQCRKYGAEYWFILREIPPDEMEKRQLRADVDYALMLGGASF